MIQHGFDYVSCYSEVGLCIHIDISFNLKWNKLHKFIILKFAGELMVFAQRGFIATLPYRVVG